MDTADFTTTIVVDRTPIEVFNAVNNVRGWWSEEIDGSTDKLNEVFFYHFEDLHHCHIRVVELIPGEKVAWHMKDNYFKFTSDTSELTGTEIIFEISGHDNNTQLTFTHKGLLPLCECYTICRDAWTIYIQNSLRSLILTGKGQPNAKGKPRTEDEKRLLSTQEK